MFGTKGNSVPNDEKGPKESDGTSVIQDKMISGTKGVKLVQGVLGPKKSWTKGILGPKESSLSRLSRDQRSQVCLGCPGTKGVKFV